MSKQSKDIELVRSIFEWDMRGAEEDQRYLDKAGLAFERLVTRIKTLEAQLKNCQSNSSSSSDETSG